MKSPRLRVGYVVKVFPRLSETFVLSEILELERQGVEVEIFSLQPPRDTRYHAELAELAAPISYLPRPESSEMWHQLRQHGGAIVPDPGRLGVALAGALGQQQDSGVQSLWQGLWLAAQARLRTLDHLHAHFASSATRAALVAHQASGITFSFTAHAKDIYAASRDPELLGDALARCAFAVTVTDFNLRHLRTTQTEAVDKLRRIYNGLPIDTVQPAPPVSSQTILAVGRLVEKKGFQDLVQACRILLDRGREFRCQIIGEGPERAALEAAITRARLDDVVELKGAQPRGLVLDAMRRCRVFTLPCVVAADGNRDALPTVLIEAMALARPVVSTDLEGVTEMVRDGESGLLVRQRDPHALAAALDRVLADDEVARRFGHAGRQRAERLFDLRANVAALRRMFERTVEGTRTSPQARPTLEEVAS